MKNKTSGFSRKLIFVIVLAMLSFSAFSQEVGLVLSGGGGKGAYQVGVWKALKEYGIAQKVTTISGTSVGGLNAALFALDAVNAISMDTVLYIWRNLVPQYLVKTDYLVFNISQPGLEKIIDMLPMEKLYYKYPLAIVTSVRNRWKLLKATAKVLGLVGVGDNAHRFCLNVEDDVSEIKKMLLSTSAIPVIMSPITLNDGYEYTDGGQESVGGDNIPIDGVVEQYLENAIVPDVEKIDTIYVVYLAHDPARRIKVKNYDRYNVIEIIPSIDLGWIFDGTLNFTADRINLLIDKGYEDTVKILRENGLYPVSAFWF